MIISNNQIRNLLNQYLKQDAAFSPNRKEEVSKLFKEEVYNFTVSQDAKAYSMVKQAIKDLPDIREDRLAKIQKQVKTGTYEVTNEEVAEKMIGRSLVDELV